MRAGTWLTSTILTLSERWFTTQISVAVRADTATGSRPTGTLSMWFNPLPLTSKISR